VKRTITAIAVGLVGAIFIWVATPVNNCLLFNAFISDDYLPVGAMLVMLVLVLAVNPLLCRWSPRFSLDGKQLALIFGILLVASVTPGQGLLRQLPYSLARSVQRASREQVWADRYKAMDPPPALFPGELRYGADVPVADKMLDKLDPGESIPWAAWLPPLLSWSGLLVPWWVMMLTMALIFLPQWRDTERVTLPLLEVHRLMVVPPEKGRSFPPVFRNKLFIVSCGIVFLVHTLGCASKYWSDSVPAIPFVWRLHECFTEGIWRYVPWWIHNIRVHFIYIGVAYFMARRVGFSIWFTRILFALWIMLANAYSPPYRGSDQTQLQFGAGLMIPLVVIWLARRHIKYVISTVFRRPKNDGDRMHRMAAIGFAMSVLCMFAWLIWVHVHPVWALALIAVVFLFSLMITRLVAETGLPLIAPEIGGVYHVIRILPVAWRSAGSMFWAGIVGFLATQGNRVCAATMGLHALGLDPKAGPKKLGRLAGLLLVVLVLSLVICGGAHLAVSYSFDRMLNQSGSLVSGDYGVWHMLGDADGLLQDWHTGRIHDPGPGKGVFILYGAILALVLYILCLSSPRWPLHPVALVLGAWYGWHIWFNVLIGWFLRVMITRYGGARAYSRAKPIFLGMILGEIMAVAVWVVFGGIRAALGLPYMTVDILPY
jgi:hypothetical protein